MPMGNPIGIYEKALPQFATWEELLECVRDYGYDFLEMSVDESEDRLARIRWSAADRQAVRRAVENSGVPIRHLCLSAHRRIPFASADPLLRRRAWEILDRALEICGELGIRILQTQGHDVYYEESTPDSWKRYLEGLVLMAEKARSASVMVGLENADAPAVASIEQGLALCDHVANPWFRLYPDIGNLIAQGVPFESQLRKALPHAVAVHIKDARLGEFRRVGFGEGTVPFEVAFSVLREAGYRGPLVVEMWNDGAAGEREIARAALSWLMPKMGSSAADAPTGPGPLGRQP